MKIKIKILLLVSVIFFLKVSTWSLPLVRDGYGYAFVGSELAKGSMLYRDIWDHKPPGVYLLDAGIYRVFPSYIDGIRFMSVLFALFSTLSFYKLLSLYFPEKTSILATLLFSVFSNVYVLTQGDNLIESYMIPMVILSVFFFVTGQRTNSRKKLLFSGIFSGLAFLFKQVGILPFAAVFLYLLFKRERIRDVIVLLVGNLIILLPMMMIVLYNSNLSNFIDAVFLYNFLYARQGYTLSSIAQSLYYILHVIFASLLLWVLAIIGLISRRKFKDSSLFMTLLIFSALGAFLGGRFAFSRNYFLLVLPWLGFFATVGLSTLIPLMHKKGILRTILILYMTVLMVPSLIFQIQATLSGMYFQGSLLIDERQAQYLLGLPNYYFVRDEKEYFTITDYLRFNIRPGEYILDWGAEPELYLLTGARTPSKYFYNFPLNGIFTQGDALLPHRRKEFIENLRKNNPVYIILNNDEIRHQPSYADLDFPQLKDILRDRYVLETKIGNYLLFRLKKA